MESILSEIGSHPKLLESIAVVSSSDEVQEYLLIKNPRTSKYLKIGKGEYSILSTLDGKKSLEDIYQKFGSQYSCDKLNELIARAYKLRLLEKDCISKEDEKNLGIVRRIIRNFTYEKLFHIKIKTIRPDYWLNRIHSVTRFLFNRYVLIVSLAVILAGLIALFSNWTVVYNTFWQAVHSGEILIMIVPLLAIIILHELAHGLLCKHFGGYIYEMGFMFFYFAPTFYCNVTDSYRFNRGKRISINGAGIYLQFVLGSCSILVWFITGSSFGTWGRLALLFSFVNYFSGCLNLIPFIKLDGYWILSAIVQIDNLRQKSFEFLGLVFMTKFLGISRSKYKLLKPGKKERIVFSLYGIMAVIFTLSLLVFIGFRFGEYLVSRLGTIGFVIFIIVLFIFLLKAISVTVKFIFSVFRSGFKPFLRLIAIVIIFGSVIAAILLQVNTTYWVRALYRVIPPASLPSAGDAGTGTMVKLYLSEIDVEAVRAGQEVAIDVFTDGVLRRIEGTVSTDAPRKELYYNTSQNFALTPLFLHSVEKIVLLAKFNDPGKLLLKEKTGSALIQIGKLKLAYIFIKKIQRLLPKI
jgi:putative peptide zinc metalloprotease protein